MHDAAGIDLRAARHAALGDPVRLTIADQLSASDRSPIELRRQLGLESNLLAHHLDVLEHVGLIERSRSSGDGRRRYVHLRRENLGDLAPRRAVTIGPALFVCSANSARSQLAAALWHQTTGEPASSAGTHPAEQVHPGAIAAAARAGLDLGDAVPQDLSSIGTLPSLVVTVCDRAHEELDGPERWLHWSVPDPVPAGTKAGFDRALRELRDRIAAIADVPGAAA
jgi:ArsR family transcriptional regulator, arsenate/arsenite/antimonite-responsive transcriptional repressor / arsenate reductase (thioredoxin)